MNNYQTNNSKEMNTIVETFIIEETAELIYDGDKLTKWNSLVNELGLQGQSNINTPEKSPNPFMHMKNNMVNIFDCLCPKRDSVENYKTTPIPLEILEIIALAKRENYFDEIQIWSDDKAPDPACIGVVYETWYAHTNEGGLKGSFKTKAEAQIKMENEGWDKRKPYPTNPTFYLMGKWADVKHSFDELKQMAVKRFQEFEGNKLKHEIVKAQRALLDLETLAFEKFTNGNNSLPF